MMQLTRNYYPNHTSSIISIWGGKNQKPNNSINKWTENLNRHFFEEDIHCINMDEPRNYNTKGSKSDIERQISYHPHAESNFF